jgi:phosphatidylserine/phosphatidylglycerophosphate/cardiolipin synthase-like enzyme
LKADVKVIDQVGAASAPVGQRYNEIAPSLLGLVKSAQKEIVIENPYVVLTEDMMKAFEDASKRGVNITIVTNSPESTDSAVTQGFFLNDWKKLEERVPTARIFVATGERKFHAKAFVLDGKVSGDTSYNADLLSGLVNGEVGAVTRSEANAQDLLSRIHDDLADPRNKFREWTIQRDASGNVVKDARGEPIALHGPEQDVSQKLQTRYKPVQFLCDLLTRIPLGAPLSHRDNE